jgi:hypothetical protein
MSTISAPLPVKLFVGMLSSGPAFFSACAEALSREFGPLDFQSPLIPWDHSRYYAREMGPDLLRQFIFFERTVLPDVLPHVKQRTAELEQQYAVQGDAGLSRRINLDPGYVTEAKVVIATAKDFPHRVYIGSGVFAEATLRYSKDAGSFIPLEHTYPDFRMDQVRAWFCDARGRLRRTLAR